MNYSLQKGGEFGYQPLNNEKGCKQGEDEARKVGGKGGAAMLVPGKVFHLSPIHIHPHPGLNQKSFPLCV